MARHGGTSVQAPRQHHQHRDPLVGGETQRELPQAETDANEQRDIPAVSHRTTARNSHRADQHPNAEGAEHDARDPGIAAVDVFDDTWHRDLHHAERTTEHDREEQQGPQWVATETELGARNDGADHASALFGVDGAVIGNDDAGDDEHRRGGQHGEEREPASIAEQFDCQPAQDEAAEAGSLTGAILQRDSVHEVLLGDEQRNDCLDVWRVDAD